MILARKKVLFLSVSKHKGSKKNTGVKKATIIRESETPKNWECWSREAEGEARASFVSYGKLGSFFLFCLFVCFCCFFIYFFIFLFFYFLFF